MKRTQNFIEVLVNIQNNCQGEHQQGVITSHQHLLQTANAVDKTSVPELQETHKHLLTQQQLHN